MLKMNYAIKNNELVHISEVEGGLKCGCVCPSCSAKLVARKGRIKMHHFAHVADEDCKSGMETVLHMMAKLIFENELRMRVPKVYVLTKFTGAYYGGHFFTRQYEEYLTGETCICFNNVKLENKIDEFIPDVALCKGNQCLLVEIKVSHGVDDVKMQKIKNTGISLIEVDLSDLNGVITENELRAILINGLDNKYWIFNKRAEYYRNEWFNLCDKFKPTVKENPKTKYDRYRYSYQVCGCPKKKRVNRKSNGYAIIELDCFHCEYCIDIEYEPRSYDCEVERIIKIYCSGRTKISSIDDLKAYLEQDRGSEHIKELYEH